MRNYKLIILLFLMNAISYAQKKKISKDDYEMMINYCTEKIKEAPNNYFYYEGRADAKSGLGKYKEAIDDYSLAIKRNKSYSMLYYDRGVAWFEINNLDSAKMDFIRAIKIKKSPQAYHYIGLIYDIQKNYGDAIINYGKAIKDSVTYADAYYNRGLCLSDINDYKSAISDFKMVIKINDNVNARINIAYNYAKLKQFNNAENEINSVLQKDTTNNIVYRYKGLIAVEENDMQKACVFFKKAKNLGAKNVDGNIKKYCIN